MIRRTLAAAAMVSAVLVTFAPAAGAHARLVSSSPAGGATVTDAPGVVRLDFDERIESSFGGVQVFDPAGVRVGEQSPPNISGSTVELPIAPLESAGTYTVVFRVISGDGHPIEARYSFIFQPPSPATTTTVTAAVTSSTTAPPQVNPAGIELEDAGSATTAGLWVSRVLNYLGLALVVGFLLAAAILLPGREGTHPAVRRASTVASVVGALWAASGLALFAFGLSNAAARPLPDVLSGELLGRFAGTRFGWLALAQAAAASVVTLLAAASRSRPVLAKAALAVAAVGAVAPGLWGHAGTDQVAVLAVANDWAHVLGVATWVGGLAALTFLLLRRAELPVSEPVGRFSRMAGWALLVVGATGAANTVLHLGGFGQLTDTGWGRLAVLKAALFASIAGVGYLARSRALPKLSDGEPGTRRAFARLAGVELLLMVAAFGVATQMASGVPADAEAASRVQSIATTFGDGQLNVTVEPARTGDNVVHIYVLDRNGIADKSARGATLSLEQGGRSIQPRVFVSGPGHWSAFDLVVPTKGEWIIRVSAATDAGAATATGAVTIR